MAEAEAPPAEGEPPADAPKKKKKKKDEWRDLVDDDTPVKFKKIDFDHALTKEEKKAKRDAKKAKKSGKEPKEPKPKKEKPEEKVEEPVVESAPEAKPPPEGGEGEGAKKEKKEKKEKPKKGKKDKKKPDSPDAIDVDALNTKIPDMDDLVVEEQAPPAKKGKGKKGGKEKKEKPEKAEKEKKEKPDKKAKKTEQVIEEEGVEEEEHAQKKEKKAKKAKPKKEKGKEKKSKSTEKIGVEEEEGQEKPEKGKKGKEKKGKEGKEKGKGKKEKQVKIEDSAEKVVTPAVPDYTSFIKLHTIQSDEEVLSDEEYEEEEIEEKKQKKKGKKDKKGKGKKGKEKEKEAAKSLEELVGEEEEDLIGQGPPPEEVPPPPPSDAELGKKGKKGKDKKGKKGKKQKVEPEEVPVEPEIPDFMKEIMMMKKMAELESQGLELEEEEVVEKKKKKKEKKKPKPKAEGDEEDPKLKKLSKKQRLQLEWERAERAKIEAELEKQRQIELEKQRKAEELRLATEHDSKLLYEHTLRVEQLNTSLYQFEHLLDKWCLDYLKEKEDIEWQQYLKCDGLPNPGNCAEMNTYLHLWDQAMEDMTMDKASQKNTEVVGILNDLQNLIDDDPYVRPKKLLDDYIVVRNLFRNNQVLTLDTATYKLLRDINNNLNRIDIPTADYTRTEPNFSFNIFVMVQLPTPMHNPRAPPNPPISLEYENMKMSVNFPASIDCIRMAIRAMYVKYDYYSDLCKLYEPPEVPEKFTHDLLSSSMEEWYVQRRYKYDNRKKPKKPKPPPPQYDEDMNEIPPPPPPPPEPEPDLSNPENIPDVPYQKLSPTPSEYMLYMDEKFAGDVRTDLKITLDPNVLNLRKYTLLGGLYHLNLFYQPPQYKEMVSYECMLTVLQIPKSLQEVPFYVPYKVPVAADPNLRRTPEEIEDEMRKQEEELDKLMLITLTIPDHVMWLDIPTLCFWNSDKKVWTTDDIYDVKHVEEKGYVTFRTGKFGIFGLATYRYANMPFQTWEVKPEKDGLVIYQLAGALVSIEFTINRELVCISQLQNAPNNTLQDIIGVYMRLPKLIPIIKRAGLDVFTCHDTFCYVEGTTCEKHFATEHHTYACIGLLSHVYNFAWSRWNLNAGRRNIVMQIRPFRVDRAKQKPHSLAMICPDRSYYVNCTEVSQTFNNEPVPDTLFYADLLHLVRSTSGISLRSKLHNIDANTAITIADLLQKTRPLSHC